jgi:general secretion pathway protein L
MGAQTLGIDIADGFVAGVVLEQQRRTTVLVKWGALPLSAEADVASSIDQLCEHLEWQGERSVLGLPLSLLSVRNLALPFTDVKKITQALPFELEEQMLKPLESLTYDYSRGRKNGGESSLVVFTTDQLWLGELLKTVETRVDPDRVLPAMVPLAEQVALSSEDKGPFVLVYADLHSISIALVVAGVPVFYRRLSHPEQMIVHPPFFLENNQVEADMAVAKEGVRLLARMIEQSLDFFHMESKISDNPERVVLAGPLAGMEDELLASTSAALHLPVDRLHLLELSRVICSEEQKNQWNSPQMDRALAVALSAKQKDGLNLRQHQLAKKRSLFSERRRMLVPVVAACGLALAGLGYMGLDTYGLQQRDTAVRLEMTSIFKATFPEVTRIQDPYIEMQAKLKNLQGSESPMPYFVTDAWVVPLLADISRRLPASLPLKVGRMSMEREGVVMKGTTDTFNGVELIKTALSGSQRLRAVQIVSATADKGKQEGGVRFEIHMQLERM